MPRRTLGPEENKDSEEFRILRDKKIHDLHALLIFNQGYEFLWKIFSEILIWKAGSEM